MRLQLLCRVKESAGWRGRALAELSRRSGTSRVYLVYTYWGRSTAILLLDTERCPLLADCRRAGIISQ